MTSMPALIIPLGFTCFIAWGIALSVSDIRSRRLPNPLTGAGAVAVFGYALLGGEVLVALLGAALLALPYLVVHLVAPAACGAGDMKLCVPLGAVTALAGGQAWVIAALGAPALTAVLGVAYLLWRPRAPAEVTVPHGPSMCLATLVALLVS